MSLRRLLTVEDAHVLEGHGVIVLPALPFGTGRFAKDEAAELRRPDGSVLRVELHICVEMLNRTLEAMRAGVPAAQRTCILKGVVPSDVVIGSEIWSDGELVQDALGSRPG